MGQLADRVLGGRVLGRPGRRSLSRWFGELWTMLGYLFRPPSQEAATRVFVEVMQLLNARWFLERGLLLHPEEEERLPENPPPRVWEVARPALARVEQTLIFPFGDEAVTAYVVRHLYPGPGPHARHPCFHDPKTGLVVIDATYVELEVLHMQLWSRWDETLDRYLGMQSGMAPEAWPIRKRYYQGLLIRHADPQELLGKLFRRALAEELRHAVSTRRCRRGQAGAPAIGSDDWYRRLGDDLLSSTGRLRRLFWEPAESRGGAALLLGEEPVRLGNVLNELSAQMTAGAVSDPALVLLEWWRKLATLAATRGAPAIFRYTLSQHPEHTLAGVLGTALLGERLGCGPALSRQLLDEPDFGALANAAWELAARLIAELRCALQAIYREEFSHAIDEMPFPEITPQGEIRDRSDWQRR
jgi:hypothetical protein